MNKNSFHNKAFAKILYTKQTPPYKPKRGRPGLRDVEFMEGREEKEGRRERERKVEGGGGGANTCAQIL